MTTAGPPDAASAGGDEPRGLLAVAEALRAEMAALRTEVASVRDSTGAAAHSSGEALEDVRLSLEARLAVLEDTLDGLSERLEALARDGASTTTALLQSLGDTVRGLPAALATREQSPAGDRAGSGELTSSVQDLRRDLEELGSGMISATGGLVQELRGRSDREAEHVRSQLAAVRAGFDARADELAATVSRGLAELAEEVDLAATTARDGSARVTALTEIFEAQRAAGERQLAALREDLIGRTSSLLGVLGARLDDVETRLGAVEATAAHGAGAAERVAAGLEDLTRTAERLDAAVAGFRTEWPTRTYEVVRGARAVAEGVVLEVREEVGARIDEVRVAMQDVVRTVDAARTGLDDGTDRLAQGGAVLVAYLEQRDRLLEAERDRVLHDVLDAFAAGLSARERSALAGRVTDAVARRRDARDAERYREALGEPVPPTAVLPDEVRELAERVVERPAQEPAATAEAPGEMQVPRETQLPAETEPREPAAGAPTEPARPPVARGAAGGTTVVPGPGRAVQGEPRSRARTSRTVAAPGRGRGRVDAMPQAPNVDVALDAASSGQDASGQDASGQDDDGS